MRDISTGFRDEIEGSQTTATIVIFATITHPQLSQPIAVNTDIVDYNYNGAVFRGCAFSLTELSDDEQTPRAQVSIENVDQVIGEAIQALPDSPVIKFEILLKSDFDDAVPRNPIGTPVAEFTAPFLKLQNVKCDVLSLTGELIGIDLTTEPAFAIRSTKDKAPGLYR